MICDFLYQVHVIKIFIVAVCGCDRMVIGFSTTYAANHHDICEFETRSGRSVKHYAIKFISDFRQVGGFLRVLRFPPPIKQPATI